MKILKNSNIELVTYPYNVYGWGDEPSTKWFLKKIEEKVKPGMYVADVGAGTGILALRAAELGAKVVAFEELSKVKDLIQKNVELNNFQNQIEVRERFPDDFSGKMFDIIFANIGDAARGINFLDYSREVVLYDENKDIR